MNQKKKLLVVDDEPDVRAGLVRLFEFRGYEVFKAENGGEALHILENNPGIAAVILDIMMPGLSGLEVLSRIKETERNQIPVILLTAKSTIGDVASGYNKGAHFYITKPFDPRVLLNAVDYLVGSLTPEEHAQVELDLLTADGVAWGLRSLTS